MTEYEILLTEAGKEHVRIIENFDMAGTRLKGLYCDSVIAIRSDLTETEKKCVLAEELGHHYTATGNIIDQSSASNRKQEMHGRILAYNRLVGLRGIIGAYNHHCQSLSETAEYLGVTEDFLKDTLNYYKSKYGICTTIDNYVIIFEPAIAVMELL